MDPVVLSEMVSRVVSDRYRIDRLVGVGSVSAVFDAFDLHDDRRVALKVFDEVVAEDEDFVAELLEAAEQASNLRHTNIAEIYDFGFDGGPYIVSELCEGGSLAGLMAEGHTLAPSQVLVMALECARALNSGHEQGVVHTNLTPNNILFTDEERVRITDYGLASVLSDAPIIKASRTLDHARYASPEQARGREVTSATDLFSLALAASEAASGVAPEADETLVGTLMNRAEAAPELASELGELFGPFERCVRLEPDARPEAEELAIALLAAAESMSRPAPLPLVGLSDPTIPAGEPLHVLGGAAPESDLDAIADTDLDDLDAGTVLDAGTDVEAGSDVDAGREGDAGVDVEVDDVERDTPLPSGLDNLEDAEPVFAEVPSTDTPALDVPDASRPARSSTLTYEEAPDEADEQLPWWPLALLGLMIAGALAAGVYFFQLADRGDTAAVPDVVGMAYGDLEAELAGRGWNIERLEGRLDGSETGSILAQSPAAGAELDKGETLSVTVSLGNEMVEIPSDIVGLTVDQAASRLATVGLGLGEIAETNSEALEAGLVIGLNEPTTQMPTGQGVALLVSSGPEDRIVPSNLAGLTIGEATSLLVGMRLQPVEEPTYDPEVEAGVVLSASPTGGALVPADSAVTLLVSAGPEPVEMPDIVGLQLDEAIDVIEELGLVWIDETGTPGEEVIGSLPPIGAVVDVGTEVTIILADPPDDE